MESLATHLECKLNLSQEFFNDFSSMMENLLELGYVYGHLQILMHKVASTSQINEVYSYHACIATYFSLKSKSVFYYLFF